jgi:hypothetical protein
MSQIGLVLGLTHESVGHAYSVDREAIDKK